MYELESEKAESLLEEAEQKEEFKEQHFLFADKTAGGLEEIREFYSIVSGEESSRMLHVRGASKNAETEINTSKVVKALKKEGYRPFLKLDVKRYILEKGDGDSS
ncbi:MAG: hypothetical protein ABEK04_02540 [Candidatus Nanohalobium sp.]